MRIAFVTARFRPDSPKGHDQHTVSLVKALKLLGLEVEVFAPRDIAGLHPLAQRREEWHGVGVTWLHGGEQASPVEWAQALDAFFERESPDVVHFDTMVGDGIALAEVVRTRGLASLVHLNDYRTLGQDARALGADLVPYDAEDMEARARGLLVDRLLDQHPGLGRHGGHLIPELVEPPFWEHLQALLHGPEAEGLEAARDEVQTYRERSARAFESWSARFANSRWLSAYFEEVLGTSVDGLLPGVERSTFAGLVPPRAGRGPVRFGFVGEMDKASGALLLLDAFAGLDGRAELRLFGSGDDRLFMRILRGHAQEVGARWYGAPEAGTRAQIFDRIDVLVVPSLWAESAPYEVLEALAARRPVIVCDLEPTCEAVEHGQTGWHFAAGDVGALRAAMLRFVEQPELLQQFEANIPIPRDITEEAREWADAYAVAIATKASSTLEAQAPPHLEALAERYHELQRLPTRELFEKVVGGLMGLSARMGVELDPAEALVRAVAAGGPGRDVRLAYERIHEWLEGHAEDLKLGRQQLLEQEAHLRREREQVQEREQSMTLEWQGQSHELGTLRQALEKATTQSEEALERMRQFEREAIERVRASERRHAETIQRDRQLRVHLGTLASRLLSAAEAPVRAGEAIEPEDVEAVMEALMTVTRRTQEEIAWRRGEMARAKQASTGFLARLVGGEATSVMRDWDEIPMPQRPMEPAAWMGSDAQANLAFRPSAAAGSPARDIPVELPNFEPTPSAGSQTEISS